MMLSCLRIVLFMLSMSAEAAQAPADDLQQRLNSTHSLSAKFNQIVRAKNHVVSQASGTMALQRPGKFLWHTQSPMEQRVIADGQRIWVYDVDLEQVSVKKQSKGIGGTPALFLSGYDHTVTRDFTVTLSQKGGKDLFDLKPRSAKDNFQHIQLGFKANALVSIDLFDQLGQQTHVQLSQIQMNPKLSAHLFSFTPPKGTDVLEQ